MLHILHFVTFCPKPLSIWASCSAALLAHAAPASLDASLACGAAETAAETVTPARSPGMANIQHSHPSHLEPAASCCLAAQLGAHSLDLAGPAAGPHYAAPCSACISTSQSPSCWLHTQYQQAQTCCQQGLELVPGSCTSGCLLTLQLMAPVAAGAAAEADWVQCCLHQKCCWCLPWLQL